ncbi:LamG domain-containing protein [Candidatus Pacearchaeota archaeon]|nr:LamG domain-containing protein [Candidatus Pacearchaeota archaeon]
MIKQNMNKRGISGVVVTVILIAMAVGLVAIVWVVVANMVDEGLGSAVAGSSRVALKIDDSGIKTTATGYSVKIDRTVGEGELAKVKFILTDSEDNSKVVEYDSSMEQSESSRFNFDLELFGEGKLKDLVEVKVVPIIVLNEQETELGTTDTLVIENMPVTAEDDLVGYWKLNNNAGDSSGNGNSGINNNVGFVEDGERGTVGVFDGVTGTEVEVPANTMFDFTGDYTLSAWVKPAEVGRLMGIIGKKSSGWGLSISDDNKFRFGYSGCGNIGSETFTNIDTWYHVVGVYSEGISNLDKIFIDGVLDKSGSLNSGNCNDDAGDVLIGRHKLSSGQNFNGQMDEVRVYSKALSATEIQMMYRE